MRRQGSNEANETAKIKRYCENTGHQKSARADRKNNTQYCQSNKLSIATKIKTRKTTQMPAHS